MNILREARRISEKSLLTRIMLIALFSIFLIINTYAWRSSQKDVRFDGIEGYVTSWDVSYYVEDEQILDQTAVFVIDELYPGMPNREDIVHIYNEGTSSTQIYYQLTSVKVFGVEILNDLKTNNEIQREGNTTNIFSTNTNYPFNVSYTYDKNYLKDKYVDDETTPDSVANFSFNVSWPYEEGDTEEELTTKDLLDTKFGKDAYQYYQDENNDPSKAIEIAVRITSNMIHPNLTEPDMTIQNSDITVETEGAEGEGQATLTLKEEYRNLGYYIEYFVGENGDELNETVTWSQGNVITGLSENDIIYVKITDGTKYAEGMVIVELTDLFE